MDIYALLHIFAYFITLFINAFSPFGIDIDDFLRRSPLFAILDAEERFRRQHARSMASPPPGAMAVPHALKAFTFYIEMSPNMPRSSRARTELI